MLKSFIAISVASATISLAPNESISDQQETWRSAPVLVFADGRCNDDYEPIALSAKNISCWYPVHKSEATFYVKNGDFGIGRGRGKFYSNEGWVGSIPLEVWVMGLHAQDPTVRFRKSMTLYRVSCSDAVARYSLIKLATYGASGNLIDNAERPKSTMKIALPGSKEESIAFAVCK